MRWKEKVDKKKEEEEENEVQMPSRPHVKKMMLIAFERRKRRSQKGLKGRKKKTSKTKMKKEQLKRYSMNMKRRLKMTETVLFWMLNLVQNQLSFKKEEEKDWL